MNTQDSGRTPVSTPQSMIPTRDRKGTSTVIAIVILVAIIGGAYYWKTQKSVTSGSSVDSTATTTPSASSAAPAFTFTTSVTGTTCTMNVCANGSSTQCIPLSGTVDAAGSCTLDQKQATPEAQGLLAIVAPAKQ